jgi:hypothetical protein
MTAVCELVCEETVEIDRFPSVEDAREAMEELAHQT